MIYFFYGSVGDAFEIVFGVGRVGSICSSRGSTFFFTAGAMKSTESGKSMRRFASTKMSAGPIVDLSGKKALVTGIANNRSIAWGIAQQLKNAGAEIGVSYLPINEKMEGKVCNNCIHAMLSSRRFQEVLTLERGVGGCACCGQNQIKALTEPLEPTLFVPCDVQKPGDVENLAQVIKDQWGKHC